MAPPFSRIKTPRESNDFSDSFNLNNLSKDRPDMTVKETTATTTQVTAISDHGEESSPPKGRFGQLWSFIDQWWIFETSCWLLSLASLMGIVGILAAYNNKPMPTWNTTVKVGHYEQSVGFTINTIISLFATVLQSSILVPVIASLSQLKWMSFQSGRPLSDFQRFDDAAGGPLGSIILLWKLRGRHIACLGSLIIIALLALGVSVQSIVAFPPQRVKAGTAKIDNSIQWVEPSETDLGTGMMGSIYAGLYQTKNELKMRPTCITGNCTWSEYTSLGVCSRCFDVTGNLVETTGESSFTDPATNLISMIPYSNYTLPNGLSISGIPDPNGYCPILEIGGKRTKPAAFHEMRQSVSILSVLLGSWTSGSTYDPAQNATVLHVQMRRPQALQCNLYYCAKKYNATVEEGVLTENVVDTFNNNDASTNEGDYEIVPPRSWSNLSSNSPEDRYYVDPTADSLLTPQFVKLWQGSLINLGPEPSADEWTPSSNVAALLAGMTTSQIANLVSNVATSMTNYIRTTTILIGSDPAPVSQAIGTAWIDTPIVAAQWGWIALPCVLLALALVLLVTTMYQSGRQDTMLWKKSSLAVFYHPLTNDGAAKISEAHSPRELDGIAKNIAVRLERTENGHRFVQLSGEDS